MKIFLNFYCIALISDMTAFMNAKIFSHNFIIWKILCLKSNFQISLLPTLPDLMNANVNDNNHYWFLQDYISTIHDIAQIYWKSTVKKKVDFLVKSANISFNSQQKKCHKMAFYREVTSCFSKWNINAEILHNGFRATFQSTYTFEWRSLQS